MMKLSLFLLLFTVTLIAQTRIMPLGDSITYDDAYKDHPSLGSSGPRPASQRYGYRSFLWYKLEDAKYNVDFVGSRSAGSAIVPPFDPDNEGYPGETSAYIASHVYHFLELNPADIILLHIGSNDWSSNVSSINTILNEIDRYEANYHHHIKVILAKIINRREYQAWTHTLNINIQNLASQRISNGDDIYVVDMEYGAGIHYDSRDFQDRTHPNDNGYQKMATVWFNALELFLKKEDYDWLPAVYYQILN